MKGQSKIVPITIIILFIIIIAEIIYLVSFQYFTPPESPQPEITNPPSLELTWAIPKHHDALWKKMVPNMAIDGKVMSTLIDYKKGILQSSTINNTFKGKIKQIDSKGGKAFYDYYDYKLKIEIENADGTLDNTFYFSDEDLSKTKLYLLDKDKETPISYEDLSIGDNIIIEDVIDALKALPSNSPYTVGNYLTYSWGSNRISAKIIKIK